MPEEYKPPENGFLVVCMTLGRHVIVPPDLKRLALVIGKLYEEAREMYPKENSPIQCFELGREMSVALEWHIARIDPMVRK